MKLNYLNRLSLFILFGLFIMPSLPVIAQDAVEEEVIAEETSEGDDEEDEDVVQLDKVVVTGSRIKRSQVEQAAPVTVITRGDVDNQGFQNLTQALQALPFNNAYTQNEQNTNTFTPNAAQIDLRNLGPGRTLVLVNGRRMADYPFPYNNSSNFVNIGTIPSGLIDRVEVLTSGSSAVYGSDAVAGVVNIITRSGIDYSEIDATYFETEAGENVYNFTASTGSFVGNTSYTLGFDFYHTDPLYLKNRPGFDSWLDNPAYVDETDPQYGSGWIQADYIVSLLDFLGRNETGAAQSAALGYSCPDVYGPAFPYTKSNWGYTGSYPGTYCVQDFSDDRATLGSERDEYTFMATVTHNFDNGVTLDARGFFFDSESYNSIDFSQWFYLPYVVADVPVDTYSWIPGNVSEFQYVRTFGGSTGKNAQFEATYEEQVTDLFVGLSGVLDNGWEWTAGYNYTEYESEDTGSRLTTKVYDWITGADKGGTIDVTGWLLDYAYLYDAYRPFGAYYGAVADAFFAQAANPAMQAVPCGYNTLYDPFGYVYSTCLDPERAFGPVSDSDIAPLNGVETTGAESSSEQFDIQLSGELDYSLSGGPIAFAAVFEHHKQDYRLIPDPIRVASDLGTGTINFINGSAVQGGGERDRTSLGIEVLFPVHPKLEITLATRSDDYDDASSAIGRRQTNQISFAYRPTENLLIRGSGAESFRAPDLHYVFAGSSSYFSTVTDYVACYGEIVAAGGTPEAGGFINCEDNDSIKGRFQGNTQLGEESGENFHLGLVWDITENMSFYIDTYEITIEGAVRNASVQTILNGAGYCLFGENFNDYIASNQGGIDCDLYTSSIVRSDRIAPGETYADIDEIITGNVNQAYELYRGADFKWNYRMATESWGDFNFGLISSHTYHRKTLESADSEEIDVLNDYLYEPRSRQNLSVNWRYNDWYVTYFVQRLGHTEQYYSQKGDPFIRENVSVGYDWNEDLGVSLRISNLWDVMPEKDSAYGYPWVNRNYYSLMGRSFQLAVNYRF